MLSWRRRPASRSAAAHGGVLPVELTAVWIAPSHRAKTATLGRSPIGSPASPGRPSSGDSSGPASACQAELATRFGVSPIARREALHQLQGEGFVTLHPYRGAMVAPVGAAELRDLADIFLAPQRLARAVLEAMKATDDPERWEALVAKFQLVLAAAASGRPRLVGAIGVLLANLSRYRHLGVSRTEYRAARGGAPGRVREEGWARLSRSSPRSSARLEPRGRRSPVP